VEYLQHTVPELISHAKVCIIETLEYGQDDQLCELL
jgi:hypothetical protein